MGEYFFPSLVVLIAVLAVIGFVIFRYRRNRPDFNELRFNEDTRLESAASSAFEGQDLKEIFGVLKQILLKLEENNSTLLSLLERNQMLSDNLIHEMRAGSDGSRAAYSDIQGLFERCIRRLEDLNENLSPFPEAVARQTPSAYPPVEVLPADRPESGPLRIPPAVAGSSSGFNQLISGNIDKIIKASSGGRKDVESFVRRLAEQYPVHLEVPSEGIFIIVSREGDISHGRAFVFPGSYLGRPWVDWFEMPSGVFERVESTVTPAAVSKTPYENWNLVTSGLVAQH